MNNEITLDFKKLSVVSIDQLRPNTWNPKDKDTKEFNDVKASIEANGLRGFIVVRENPKDNVQYEIIDGEQKWTACKELGFEKVAIYNEGLVSDQAAQELTLWWQVQVPFNEMSLAKLVSKMIDQFGSINTPYDEKKIAEFQELAKFDFNNYSKHSTKPPEMPTGDLMKTFMVQVNKDAYEVIIQAINKAKKQAKESSSGEVTDGRALEFVCVEYLDQADGQ